MINYTLEPIVPYIARLWYSEGSLLCYLRRFLTKMRTGREPLRCWPLGDAKIANRNSVSSALSPSEPLSIRRLPVLSYCSFLATEPPNCFRRCFTM